MNAPVAVAVNQAVLEALKKRLTAAREGLQNDGSAMRQVATFLDQWVQRNFKSQGGGVGNWTPFTYGGRLTTKDKANAKSIEGRHYIQSNAVLLQDSGRLRLSFLPFVRKGVAGIGSDLPYSEPHEEGDGVPQRRMLPKNAEVQPQVFEILDNFVVVQLRRTNA